MPRQKKNVTLADVDAHVAAKEKEERKPAIIEDEAVVEAEETVMFPVKEEEEPAKFPRDAFVLDREASDALVFKGARRGQEVYQSIVFRGEGVQPLFALNLAIILLRKGGIIYVPEGFESAVKSYPYMEISDKQSPKGYKQAVKKID